MKKPQTSEGYHSEDLDRVRRAALTLATYLHDFRDDLVIVGGLVPNLLITNADETHVGTLDLDVGLGLPLLHESRYAELVDHLESSGFRPDTNSAGKPANHRWKHKGHDVTVDFLIAPLEASRPGQQTRIIDERLSAVLSPALPLAFQDRVEIELTGRTLAGETAARTLGVCGPGSFIVLKALATRGRGEPKDAYDLLYFLRNYGVSLEAVADLMRPLLGHPEAQRALEILKEDYCDLENIGPVRAAAFLGRESDVDYRSDQAGTVRALLRLLGQDRESKR